MPITPLSLTTRSGAGAALSQTQFDANLTAIQTGVNALITQVAMQHNDDGSIKDGTVATAAKIADAIITLAKMAVLSGTDKGKVLRANPTTGAIEVAEYYKTQSATWDPGSLADGASTDTTITSFTGLDATTDVCVVNFSGLTSAKWIMFAHIVNATTVHITLVNHTGGTVDLGSGTLRVTVLKNPT